MVTRGWLYDGEEGMLLAPEGFGMQQPFPYNSAGLPLTASVDRAAQNGWREYIRQTYRWNVFSSKREGEEHNGQPTFIVANREEEMRPQTRLLLDVASTARHINHVNRGWRRVRRPRLLVLDLLHDCAHQQHEHGRGHEPENSCRRPQPLALGSAWQIRTHEPASSPRHFDRVRLCKSANRNDETSPKTRLVAHDLSPRVRRCTSMHRSEETGPQTSSPLLDLSAATHINGAMSPRPRHLVITVLRGKCANTSEETRLKSVSPQSLTGFKSVSTSDETGLGLSPASDAARAHRREEMSPKTSSPPRRPYLRIAAL
ncbi:hypothetical protein OH76DRAFT_1487988 [Lentinus brumalis]|uniref:Uncharacterized protein n=1 Tax=Lentinus brumalis TaxID=2498619 RepID=A0A371CSR9_9APHY|nr:hypothetical protein OH76DRAFT_1487988 [Polyporus brumalis]